MKLALRWVLAWTLAFSNLAAAVPARAELARRVVPPPAVLATPGNEVRT